MHAIPRRIVAATLAATLACGAASAATFTYDLTVTESIDAIVDEGAGPVNVYDLPDIGTTGTLTIDLAVDATNAADPIPPEGLATSSLLTISAAFGNLSTGLDPNFAVINPVPGRAQFRNGNASSSTLVVDLFGSIATGTLAGSFSVSAAAFGPGLPTNLGEVLAILSATDAFAFMSFNGTAAGQFVSFRAEEVASVPPIPLPAGGLLLVSALAGLTLARRRR